MEKQFSLSWPICCMAMGLLWLALVPSTLAMAYLERNIVLRAWLENHPVNSPDQAGSYSAPLSAPLQAWIPTEVVQPMGWLSYLAIGYWVVCLIKRLRADQAMQGMAPPSFLIFIAFMFAPVGSGVIGVASVAMLNESALWVSIPLSLGISLLYIHIFTRLGKGRSVNFLSLTLGLLTLLEFVMPWLASENFKSQIKLPGDPWRGLISGIISANKFSASMLLIHVVILGVLMMIAFLVSKRRGV